MQYVSHVNWVRHDAAFNPKQYPRTHHITFGSGTAFDASSAPEFLGDATLPNPEELFTASLASCFMLTFLYSAALKGIIIDTYASEAIGTLAKDENGKMAMTEVIIKPTITYHDNQKPEQSVLDELFKKAHDNCFISNSVKTKVIIQATN